MSRGFEASPLAPSAESRRAHPELPEKTYSFWGASPGTWIGPLWPRGRAEKNALTKAGPADRFCAGWSGARGFLDRLAEEPVFQKLNEGNPEAMGETMGIDEAHGAEPCVGQPLPMVRRVLHAPRAHAVAARQHHDAWQCGLAPAEDGPTA